MKIMFRLIVLYPRKVFFKSSYLDSIVLSVNILGVKLSYFVDWLNSTVMPHI